MKFVALGDCNTSHKSKYNGPKREYHAWHDIVTYELPRSVLICRGVSGEKYQNLWNRWKEDVLDEKPDVVIVFGGINNFTDGNSDPNTIMQKVAADMVASAKENGITIFLVSQQPFKGSKYWTEKKQVWLNTFNAWLRKFALSQGVVFIDAYSLLEDPSQPNTLRKEHDAWSGYHLSIAGHMVLGKHIAECLKEVLENER